MGLKVICGEMTVKKRIGMLGASAKNMKAGTVTLFGTGR
jgi:hypothetical protein